jgi:hypothetical protein
MGAMKLTVRRSQEVTDRGLSFLAFFHLELRPEEWDLVRLYDLQHFRISAYSLGQLLQGVSYEGGLALPPAVVQFRTLAVARAEDILRKENEVRAGCADFLAALTGLRNFDDSNEYLFELPQGTE